MNQKEDVAKQVADSTQGLEASLNDSFVKKSPIQLPDGVKEFIVTVMPWVNLVFLIVLLPLAFAAFGFSFLFGSLGFLGGTVSGAQLMLSGIVMIVQLVIMAISIPGLIARKKSAWNLIFYSQLIYFVYNLITWGGIGNLIGDLISLIIGLFILFQIRSYYK